MIDGTSILELVIGEKYFSDDITIEESLCNSICHNRLVCSRCANVCPTGAIKVEKIEPTDKNTAVGITIDTSKCTHCGACVVACPTEALFSEWFSVQSLLKSAVKNSLGSASRTESELFINCAQALDENGAEELNVESGEQLGVPCLAHIDESILMSLLAMGVSTIYMVHGKCRSCKSYLECKSLAYDLSNRDNTLQHGSDVPRESNMSNTSNVPIWEQIASYSNQMLEAVGSSAHVKIISIDKVADSGVACINKSVENTKQITRRELMSNAKNRVKDVALDVFTEALVNSQYVQYKELSELLLSQTSNTYENNLSEGSSKLDRDTLRAFLLTKKLDGTSRQKICEWALVALAISNYKLPDVALKKIGNNKISTRIFANISIDEEKCNRCMLCTTYCKSKAICKIQDGHRVIGIELQYNLCSQCGVCVSVCPKNAISIKPKIKVADILCEKTDTVKF